MFWRGYSEPTTTVAPRQTYNTVVTANPVTGRYENIYPKPEATPDMHHVTPRVLFDRLSDANLKRLQEDVRAELGRRVLTPASLAKVSNFLTGVTQAMAARSFLRWSKDHKPEGGVTPQSGEMWNAQDGAVAERRLAMRLALGSVNPAPMFNPLVQTAASTLSSLRDTGWLK